MVSPFGNEERFAADGAPRWNRLTQLTRESARRNGLNGSEVVEFARLYREASADLAFARLRYPSTAARLNEIVADAFGRLYGARQTRVRSGVRFFLVGFPHRVRALGIWLVISSVFLFAPIGVLYAVGWDDADTARRFLPGQFRDVEPEDARGAREADAVARGAVSTEIFTNNIRVTFLCFALGITAGLGTAFMLVYNGVLIGALAGVFAAAGVHGPFWVLILPHGFLELACIAIAGAAGLRLGWSVIDPGPIRRAPAISKAGRDTVAVAACLAPSLVVAGLIEGFITPTSIPGPLRIGFGAVVALAFLGWMVFVGRGREVAAPG